MSFSFVVYPGVVETVEQYCELVTGHPYEERGLTLTPLCEGTDVQLPPHNVSFMKSKIIAFVGMSLASFGCLERKQMYIARLGET